MKLKFAIIGLGFIGKRHAEMVRNNQHCELVGVADIDPKQEAYAQEHLQTPFYLNAETMLQDIEEVDVVCICTPNGFHAEHALLALEKNCHIVCEKPLGLSKSECEKIIYKSLQMHKQVFCVMQNRYSPPSVWLHQMMTEKKLGDIYMVQINCYWNRDKRYYKEDSWKGSKAIDGGPLFTQFSHFIDIMYWLFGDVKNIKANFNNNNHPYTEFEDSGFISFDFINGGMGSINYSTSVWDKNLESSITVIGEKGALKVGGQYMDQVEYCHIENYEMPTLPPSNPPNDYGAYKGSAANHHYVFENVIDTLQGKTTATTNALEGLKVVDIIERIYQHKES
jgi:UDP-N-acetyl-2-amino-2-deoxyglucuronate dehydrogenase